MNNKIKAGFKFVLEVAGKAVLANEVEGQAVKLDEAIEKHEALVQEAKFALYNAKQEDKLKAEIALYKAEIKQYDELMEITNRINTYSKNLEGSELSRKINETHIKQYQAGKERSELQLKRSLEAQNNEMAIEAVMTLTKSITKIITK